VPPPDLSKSDIATADPLLEAPSPADVARAAELAAEEHVRSVERALRRRRTIIGAACTGVGLLVALIALLGMHDVDITNRTLFGCAGGLVLWVGLQQLGTVRFGAQFKLGFWIAVMWLLLVVGVALFANVLPIDGYDEPVVAERDARPALTFDEPLGRDNFGRSLVSRITYGARVSLAVGVISASVGMLIGGVLGLLAGYFRGWLDEIVGIITNSVLAFPPLILLLAVVSVLDRTLLNLCLALSIVVVPTFARLARAQTLVYAQREFVLAARSMGAKHLRVLTREILPNVARPLFSYLFLVVATLIVAEGTLSFLGLGIPPPRPSWGGMIDDARSDLRENPHETLVPAFVMFMTVLSINRVGDWARAKASGRTARI
jgi:peptide/nickel transport system permease protein